MMNEHLKEMQNLVFRTLTLQPQKMNYTLLFKFVSIDFGRQKEEVDFRLHLKGRCLSPRDFKALGKFKSGLLEFACMFYRDDVTVL